MSYHFAEKCCMIVFQKYECLVGRRLFDGSGQLKFRFDSTKHGCNLWHTIALLLGVDSGKFVSEREFLRYYT